MPAKSIIAARLPIRRGFDQSEAAGYLSFSPAFFRKLVEDGTMPLPRKAGSRRVWDIEELDIAFKALPREGDDQKSASATDTWTTYE
jgi:hypothetical protein